MEMSPTAQEDGPHLPLADDGENWQESLAFQFYDPRSRVGGYLHVGLQRTINRADIWTWVAVEGRTVHNFQHLDLRLPERDFPDFRLGPLGVICTAPMTGRKVIIDDGDTQLSLQYDAFSPPRHFAGSSGSSGNFAKGHFETLGRAVGMITIGGKDIAIDAWAFDDRSWGDRDWSKLLTHRFLWASFGRDLNLSVYTVTSPAGPYEFGFIEDRGSRHEVIALDLDVVMTSSGVKCRSFEAVAWTRDAGGYRFSGKSDGNLVVTQRQGFMCSPSACRMEMNGRVGGGIIEVNELKRPTPALIAEYNLMRHPIDPPLV